MKNTEQHLKEAFDGESRANRKYIAFSAQAEKEGYTQAARLFKAAAEAEAVHASNHLRALKAIKTTKENLLEAVAGETHEFKEMYPKMIETAKADGDKNAERTFNYANEVEKVHARLYRDMLDSLETSKDQDYSYYVCSVCGLTADKVPPEKCPICGAKGSLFKRID
jgi:rubrerythrin